MPVALRSGLGSDFGHTLRALRKHPGFAATVITTLALGIGANTAIFTLMNAMILADMPVPRPDRLIEVSTLDRKGEKRNFSIPAFQQIRDQAGVFTSVFGWLGGGMENLEMNGVPFAGSVDEVAGDYYGTLGIRPAIGRLLTSEDIGLDHFTPSRVAVLGYRSWQERYHGDPAVLGKTVLMNGRPFTIIGVHPASFRGLIRETSADLTVPVTAYLASAETMYSRKSANYTVIGRLRDGVDPDTAGVRLAALWPRIREQTAPETGPEHELFLARRIQTTPAHGISYLRQRFTRPLYILFGIVGLLLLLACVNLANVASARASGRAGELSLRVALGASRWRLLRASLVESAVLALGGAIPGLVLAYFGSRFIAQFMWQGFVALSLSLRPDVRVVLFTIGTAAGAGVLFGILPAWRASGQDPGAVLQRASSRLSEGFGWMGRGLVVVQVALSFTIIAGALLFSRSLVNVMQREPGFSSDRLLMAQLFPRSTYRDFDKATYFRELLGALGSIPSVSAATLSHNPPVGMAWKSTIQPAGLGVNYHLIAPRFFETLGIQVLRGRDFDIRDDTGRTQVAIVSENLARKLSSSEDAIGRRVRIGELAGEFEIVGIVSDASLYDPRAHNPLAIYAPIFQRPDLLGWSAAVIRTSGDPAQLGRALRERIESLGREYALRIETVNQERGRALLPERILALLSACFGGLAALLACIGLYGLLSYSIARRTAEIGIRVALGATGGSVIRLVMRETAMLMALGVMAGVAITLASARVASSMLYGLSAHDPMTLLLAVGFLVGVAGLASFMPARRAIRIDPIVALRYE